MSEEKRRVRITLIGCDDSTSWLQEVTDDERRLLEKMVVISCNRGGGCQPTMSVVDADGETEERDDE